MPLFNWVPPSFAKSKFPAGIILPMLSGAVPDKWSSFTAADGKFIAGAGDSYGVGTTGGSGSISLSGTVTTTNAHTGTGSVYRPGDTGTFGWQTYSSAGAHNHTVSDSATVEDLSRTYVLVKSDVDVDALPPNIGAFGSQSLKLPLVNTHSSVNRFMKAGTVDGTEAGDNTPTSSGFTSSSNGSHTHGSNLRDGDDYNSGVTETLGTDGGHTHTGNFTTTLDTKYFYLSLWFHATAGCPHQKNMIAMWEGATAPSGWKLCDGTNGAPDLRNYFIRIGSTVQHGNFGGSNSSTWTMGSLSNAGAHSHPLTSTINDTASTTNNSYHTNSIGGHSDHTLSNVKAYVPPYYALTFIMKE